MTWRQSVAVPHDPSWGGLYRSAVDRLGDHRTARWFLEEASGGAWPAVLDEQAPASGASRLMSMVERRCSGEPVQYVLGHWAFRHLDLLVDRRALIPRPETEVVVEVALGELGHLAHLARLGELGHLAHLARLAPPARLAAKPLVAVDLGTGSGAIALSLVAENSEVEVWATDVSGDALALASANLARAGAPMAGRARLVQGNWWEALPEELAGTVDLAVANPPYIAEAEVTSLPEEVSAWEPFEALVAGATGLEALELIVLGASSWLCPRSALVAEIAPHQASAARALAREAGFGEALVRQDLVGRDRVLVARR